MKTITLYQRFGRNIRRVRTEAQLSQLQLSRRTGLSRSSIANIELGRQRVLLHDLFRFAHALKTQPQTLLDRCLPKSSKEKAWDNYLEELDGVE